jgi:excisionase family DNA binding protein
MKRMYKKGSPRKNEAWVSLDEIAKHLSVSRDSVYRAIDNRGLPAHKAGRLWKFKISEVDAWVRGGKAAADGPKS